MAANDYPEQGVAVWPEGVSSPGLSPQIAVLGLNHNAVIVEFQPQGGATSGSFQVVDSDNPNTGFHATVDANGATGTLSATDKRIVAGVHRYLRVEALAVNGRWHVKVTPITATNQQTITTTVSGTVNQGTPGASPWPVSGTVNQGTPGASPWPVDTELPVAAALADGASNPTTPMVGAALLVWNGASWDRQRTPNVFKPVAAVAVTAGTPVNLWTPASGKKFRLMGFALSLSVAGAVILKDAAAELARTPSMAAGIGLVSPPMGNGYLSAAADNILKIDVTATGSVNGYVFGTEE